MLARHLSLVLMAGCHRAKAEDRMPSTSGWVSSIKKPPQPLSRAFPNALAAFVKHPQAEAQIDVDKNLTPFAVLSYTFPFEVLHL